RLRLDFNELRRWMDATHDLAARLGNAPDLPAALRWLAELIAGELGFEHAFVRCGRLECDLPPLTAEAERSRIEEVLRECATGPSLRVVTWDDAPTLRVAVCLRIEAHAADLPPVILVAARTTRTA